MRREIFERFSDRQTNQFPFTNLPEASHNVSRYSAGDESVGG